MRLAVVGSRGYSDYRDFVASLHRYEFEEIVSGGCSSGADLMAERYSKEYDIPITIFPVTKEDWRKFGKFAGPRRNKMIVDNCDALIAFWDGKSPGTKSSIDLAMRKEIPYEIVMI